MMRRKKCGYFEPVAGAPPPVAISLTRRVAFGEVDAMAVAWHGRYAVYFEEAATELRRLCGLTYQAFHEARLRAPVVQFHVDYHGPLRLDEPVTIRAAMIWTDAARLNTEYEIRNEAGEVAAAGYTVQLFTEASTGEVCFVCPPLLERCRERWRSGAFARRSAHTGK